MGDRRPRVLRTDSWDLGTQHDKSGSGSQFLADLPAVVVPPPSEPEAATHVQGGRKLDPQE